MKYAKEDNVPCQIEEVSIIEFLFMKGLSTVLYDAEILFQYQGLFLGSIGVALNKELLKSLNLTHILIVAKSLDPAFPNDFVYKKIDGRKSSG